MILHIAYFYFSLNCIYFHIRYRHTTHIYGNTLLQIVLYLYQRATESDGEGLWVTYSLLNSVFPRHCFPFKSARVISLSGVQLSGFIHLSHVKTAIFDIVFWGFYIIFFFVFFENTNNCMFQVCNRNPRLGTEF